MDLTKKGFFFKLFSAFLLIIYASVYFRRANIYLDTDFGWRLRLGEIILKDGIPTTDPFSYTMPGYAYADHEWLLHAAIAKLYPIVGYDGLAIIFTLIAIATILIVVRGTDLRFMPMQILFAGSVLLSYFGIRPQIISWLFFAILCKCLLDKKLWLKYRFYLPVLFLIWANLHGGFIVGLLIVFFTTVVRRKLLDSLIFTVSLLVTLVNPYGHRLWQEIWVSVADPQIRFLILEWRPIIFSITSIALFSLAYCLAFILQYRNKYPRLQILLAFLLFLAAFSSTRNIPLFIIYALILIRKGIESFISDIVTDKIRLSRFYIFYAVFFTLTLFLALVQLWGEVRALRQVSENVYYPRQAVNYLGKNLPEGQIFSSFEWGGYLVWKLPQKKVFIDGRMASWRQKDRQQQSDYAFAEYTALISAKVSLKELFKKYKIDTVLMPGSWLKGSSTSKFISELKNSDFKQIYQDEVAVIFTKKIQPSIEDN